MRGPCHAAGDGLCDARFAVRRIRRDDQVTINGLGVLMTFAWFMAASIWPVVLWPASWPSLWSLAGTLIRYIREPICLPFDRLPRPYRTLERWTGSASAQTDFVLLWAFQPDGSMMYDLARLVNRRASRSPTLMVTWGMASAGETGDRNDAVRHPEGLVLISVDHLDMGRSGTNVVGNRRPWSSANGKANSMHRAAEIEPAPQAMPDAGGIIPKGATSLSPKAGSLSHRRKQGDGNGHRNTGRNGVFL